MHEDTTVIWFRRDLRLADNPALHAAASARRLVPLYLHAPSEMGAWPEGAASRWWLHHSLTALDQSLRKCGTRLLIRSTRDSGAELEKIISETAATAVYWNRLYEPEATARDRVIKQRLRARGITVKSFNAALLHEPWSLTKQDGAPYRVFTPFWKAAMAAGIDQELAAAPARLPPPPRGLKTPDPNGLGLLPEIPWDRGFYETWTPGEAGAWHALQRLLTERLAGYADCRDLPGNGGTSGLSPHLHFGEIGPRQIYRAMLEGGYPDTTPTGKDSASRFIAELGWREFGYHLLYHFPQTPQRPMNPRFERFPWVSNREALLAAWQQGSTGIPLVDAGMRELWYSGWMHNRVRMITASFLTKNLLIPWQQGARWFWDTLVDADLASNTLGWQWTAGCGADAAPYFRVFNPVLQGQRFDPRGEYVKRWLPELARLPASHIHRPWEAPKALLQQAGVSLGAQYPEPLVELKASRDRALAAYATLK